MHKARKRFGQNFLHDTNVIRRIIEEISPRSDDRFIEIGGGHGALTVPLAERVGRLDVVEIDTQLADELRQMFSGSRKGFIHNADALEFDYSSCADAEQSLRIAGNLPYNISTPLLFHLQNHRNTIIDMHLMLQKEVVDRMVAQPGTKAYGRLTVMLARWFDIEACFDIRPGSFRPQPRVTSTLTRLKVRQTPRFPLADEHGFASLVAHLFSMRRKTLGRALRGRASPELLADLEIDATVRAETLSPERLAKISDAIG